MELSNKQKKIIKFLKEQLSFWDTTNDIYSPTHFSDLHWSIMDLELENGEKELNKLTDDLLIFIRKQT